jgi:uncharacterized membrane protein
MLSPEKKLLMKELARRRLSLIFFGASFLATIFTISEEADLPLHSLDDYSIVTLSIVALVLVLVWRKKQSLPDLRKLNNILFVISVILLIFVIFAITQEINDVTDFADDPAQLILLLVLIINRFT